jgi:hypothetical protein
VKMITSSPAILGLAIDNIRGKISDLRELGFADPVKMITSSPSLLGYSRERFLLCGHIVAALPEAPASALSSLLSKRRPLIEAVATANCRSWADMRQIIAAARRKAT